VTITSEINKRNLPKDAKILVIDNPRTSTQFLLPKIHKVGNHDFQPLPTYINDSSDTGHYSHQRTPSSFVRHGCEKSVIPQEDGLKALQHFLDQRVN
jgi:hypothetical protein